MQPLSDCSSTCITVCFWFGLAVYDTVSLYSEAVVRTHPWSQTIPFQPCTVSLFYSRNNGTAEALLTPHQIRTSSANRRRVSPAFLCVPHKEPFVRPAIFVAYIGQQCRDAGVQDACCLLDCTRH